MTTLEVRQQIKNTALNEIRKIYNPNYKFPYDYYTDESCSQQREYRIKEIIEDLERDLKRMPIKS